MPLICYIMIAIAIAFILTIINHMTMRANNDLLVIGWCVVIYGLLLGFSINNFYNRWIVIRDAFINESTNLEKLLELLKTKDNSEVVIDSIYNYVSNVSNVLKKDLNNRVYSPSTEKLHLEMNYQIFNYVNTGALGTINNTIYSNLTTDTKIKKLIDEMKSGDFYISIIIFLLIVITIPLMFYKMPIFWIQVLIYSCLFIIILTLIYVLNLLNNPFTIDNNFGINLSMYNDLVNKIKTFRPNVYPD